MESSGSLCLIKWDNFQADLTDTFDQVLDFYFSIPELYIEQLSLMPSMSLRIITTVSKQPKLFHSHHLTSALTSTDDAIVVVNDHWS